MSKFDFESIIHEVPTKWSERNYIWIWNDDKIPPHVGLSVGRTYFSLTYKKAECLQVYSMLKKAKRAQIPLVLVAVKNQVDVMEVERCFFNHQAADENTSCLYPIKEVFGLGKDVKQLSDLLRYLKQKNAISSVFALNLAKDYTGIPDYSINDIQKRIHELISNK